MYQKREDIRAQCEKIGPIRVKELLSSHGMALMMNTWLMGNEHIAKVWLEEYEAKKAQELKLSELAIANEANRIANEASKNSNKIAFLALIISIIALLKDLPYKQVWLWLKGILHI